MSPDLPRKTDAVIFDLDGVLVDSERLHVKAWEGLFAERGIELTEAEYRRGIGMPDVAWLVAVFEGRREAADVEGWAAAKRQRYARILEREGRLFPGVDALVRRLHAEGYALGVASNSPRDNIEMVLEMAGLRPCFGAVTGKDDVVRHKPHPEPYLRTARGLGVAPRACVVIEDSALGIEAAHRARMRCVAVPTTMPPERLAEADRVVPSLEAVDAVMEFVNGQGRGGGGR